MSALCRAPAAGRHDTLAPGMRLQSAGEPISLDSARSSAGDTVPVLDRLRAGTFDLTYLDPPFNTGRSQARSSLEMTTDPEARRVCFGGGASRVRSVGR